MGAATKGVGSDTDGVGDSTGPPKAPPPTGARGILPPEVALLPEAGGAETISPGVPPSAVCRSSGEETGEGSWPGWALSGI